MDSEKKMKVELDESHSLILIMTLMRAKFSDDPDPDVFFSESVYCIHKNLMENYLSNFPEGRYLKSLVGKKLEPPFSCGISAILNAVKSLPEDKRGMAAQIAFFPYVMDHEFIGID